MILNLDLDGRSYNVDAENPLDISIPLKFNGEQPNAYGVEKATSQPYKAGEMIGDTRLGGSCNFEQYTFIPHCNGTHTECIGHITRERISVRDCLSDVFIPAKLISVRPERADKTNETYSIELKENDQLVSRRSLENSIRNTSIFEGLVIRTLPNDESKLNKEYGEYVPPFFSNEAMKYIFASGVTHLLVDLPSIDRIFDEGKLSNHRKFWNVGEGEFEINGNTRVNSTITELIYVPNEIKDGNYLLNLQIAAFESDASPSRPILFELKS